MQTEESSNSVEVGAVADDDNQVIEVPDDIQDDISEAFDELSEKETPAPEVEAKEEDEGDLEADLIEAQKELEGKQENPVQEKKVALDPNKPTAQEIDIKAPARFTAEEKEIFNKLSPEIKKIADKAFKEQQADYTRAKQFLSDGVKQLEAEKATNRELTNVMNRYLTKWGSNGIAPEQAIMALASVQDELTNPDKEIRKSAYARLLVNSALEPEDFAEILGGQVRQSQPQQNITAPTLTAEEKMRQSYIDSLIEKDRLAKQQSEQQEVVNVIQEIEQVKEAKDPSSGRYLYPKLHDQSFIEQAKPLVLAIMRTTGDSWGNAFKKAYHTLAPDSQPIGQTRLPSNSNRSGTTIVRESPTIRSNGQPTEFPDWGKDDGLSLEEDIMAAAEMLKRGGSGHY